MNKSFIYRLAQGAVLSCDGLYDADKLEILRELMAQEDLALFTEKREEKGNDE